MLAVGDIPSAMGFSPELQFYVPLANARRSDVDFTADGYSESAGAIWVIPRLFAPPSHEVMSPYRHQIRCTIARVLVHAMSVGSFISTANYGFCNGAIRGGALSNAMNNALERLVPASEAEASERYESEPRWHVLWTHSNCERLVYEELHAKGYELFLPTVGTWAKRRDARYFCNRALFPGYLFLRCAMDKRSYLEVCKSQGVVKILGQRWDRLAAVPDAEIEAIQKVMRADVPCVPHAYLREGQTVRITEGPLANVEGILLESRSDKGLLVLSIELLRRSVAVEVDCTRVAAA